jgi:hypothetical protein
MSPREASSTPRTDRNRAMSPLLSDTVQRIDRLDVLLGRYRTKSGALNR